MLTGKNIVLGITGSIAAYKTCDLVSALTKMGANVTCILTKAAQQFVTVTTLETLSKNKVITEMFGDHKIEVEHVSLADRVDLLVVAPATANILAKFSYGLADDFLSTFFLTNQAPVLIAPAMNTKMYQNKIVQNNITRLKKLGVTFIDPASGELACGIVGIGRLADKTSIIEAICKSLTS